MIPTYENMAKQAVVRVFNAIMTRAGITLIVTVAFSISSMFYNISTDYPFFMVAFLQIICFAGIYMKPVSYTHLDVYKRQPHALSVTVHKNQKDAESGNSAFSFSYRQENQIDGTYNIVDNPEKFTLEME